MIKIISTISNNYEVLIFLEGGKISQPITLSTEETQFQKHRNECATRYKDWNSIKNNILIICEPPIAKSYNKYILGSTTVIIIILGRYL